MRSGAEIMILEALEELGPSTARKVAEHLHRDESHTRKILERLRRSGAVSVSRGDVLVGKPPTVYERKGR